MALESHRVTSSYVCTRIHRDMCFIMDKYAINYISSMNMYGGIEGLLHVSPLHLNHGVLYRVRTYVWRSKSFALYIGTCITHPPHQNLFRSHFALRM